MTADARFAQLLSQLLDDADARSAAQELSELIAEDPALRSQLVDQLLLDVLLQEQLGQEPLIALVDSVAHSPAPPEAPAAVRQTPPSVAAARPWGRRLRWLGAVALLAAVVGWFFQQSQQRAMASATELVQAAIHTHAATVERIYLVEVRRGAPAEELVELPQNVRVATQGDRFWVQMQAQRDWVWGRDQQGAVWITLGDRQAVVVNPEEMGLPLRYIGDLYTLNLETLLASFLRYCRLELSDEAGGLRVITATPRRQWSNRPLRRAVIEVDRDTGVITRLVLERELERISSVTTFRLVESRAADPALYGPLGHLSPSGEVFGTETDIGDRRALIVSWFGSSAAQWLGNAQTLPRE